MNDDGKEESVLLCGALESTTTEEEDQVDVLTGLDVLASHGFLVVQDLSSVQKTLLLRRDVSALLEHLLDPQERVTLVDVELQLLSLHELDDELHPSSSCLLVFLFCFLFFFFVL